MLAAAQSGSPVLSTELRWCKVTFVSDELSDVCQLRLLHLCFFQRCNTSFQLVERVPLFADVPQSRHHLRVAFWAAGLQRLKHTSGQSACWRASQLRRSLPAQLGVSRLLESWNLPTYRCRTRSCWPVGILDRVGGRGRAGTRGCSVYSEGAAERCVWRSDSNQPWMYTLLQNSRDMPKDILGFWWFYRVRAPPVGTTLWLQTIKNWRRELNLSASQLFHTNIKRDSTDFMINTNFRDTYLTWLNSPVYCDI